MKKIVKFVILSLAVISCSKNGQLPISTYTFGGGVFIVNEGNYTAGNGSLSMYSYDSSTVTNDIFYKANGRPLGDVPNSIALFNNKLYVVVNNSGKIEIIDPNTIIAQTKITGLNSPRNISFVNDNKAYVSSIYSDSVAIINLVNNSISGYINIRRTSEAITITGNKAYVANWVGGNELMVIDAQTDKLIDSIEVGYEPESMVVDRFGMLWVLCDGGWDNLQYPELDMINVKDDHVAQKFTFPSKESTPSCLKIDGLGQTLYYLDGGLRQMDIGSSALPLGPMITESGAHFYKIAINAINSDIFITDAVDFQQAGYVSLYKNNGVFISKNKAGIIPGAMCFRLRIDSKPN